jgi:monofunctional biosynthetic peptidoglycan transglycosylase
MIWRFFALLFVGFLLCMGYLAWPYGVFSLPNQNPSTTSLIELRRKEALTLHRPFNLQHTWKNFGDISPNLTHAILLAEDDTFYQHHGFDFEQIRIALARNILQQKYVYGGSTITQQLARTLFLRPRKSIIRKVKEAFLTIYLEHTLTKKRILELYLNSVEWGPGIFGAEAASRYYFLKSASELTPDEAVALASILPSPRRWSPFSEKAFMARRRTQLSERMQKAGYAPVTFLNGDEAGLLPVDPDAISGLPVDAPIIPLEKGGDTPPSDQIDPAGVNAQNLKDR